MEGHTFKGTSVPRGQKRHAEDGFEDEQRFTKRFNLLNLEQNGKELYFPIESSETERTPRANAIAESMQLDDTKDKVYIHNLDDELSDIESQEERLVFLPDIEKRMTRIPRSVFMNNDASTTSSEIVLYNVPESLSVPRDQDNVRKAIIETRARARMKQAQEAAPLQVNGCIAPGVGNGIQTKTPLAPDNDLTDAPEQDSDPMDIG